VRTFGTFRDSHKSLILRLSLNVPQPAGVARNVVLNSVLNSTVRSARNLKAPTDVQKQAPDAPANLLKCPSQFFAIFHGNARFCFPPAALS